VVARLPGLARQVGALADQEIHALGQLEGAVAEAGVHDERHALPRLVHAHLVEGHALAVDVELALLDELLDGAPLHAALGQLVREHGAPVLLLEPIAEGLDPVVEARHVQLELAVVPLLARVLDGARADVADVVIDARAAEAVVVLAPRAREVDLDLVGDAVEADALGDAGQAEAVVAVEVRDADLRDLGHGALGIDHLPLCSFTRIEQEPVLVPPQQVAVVVPVTGGDLTGGPEGDDFAGRHGE